MTPSHNPDFKGEKMKKKVAKKGTPRAKKPSGRRKAPSKKPFRLEVGKTYVSRVGEIVGPMIKTEKWRSFAKTHPFTTKTGFRTYAVNGRYSAERTHEDSWDLIREVKSPKGRGK
jgi:hypothetical protein